jgi:acyl carrier protein
MNEQEVRSKVREVVGEMAPLHPLDPSPSAQLVADLGFDSLGILECITALEQEFGLPETAESDFAVETIEDLGKLILAGLRAQQRLETADV